MARIALRIVSAREKERFFFMDRGLTFFWGLFACPVWGWCLNGSECVYVYVVVEVVVEVADHFYLFLDYFGEDSIFDCEESCHAHVVFFLDFGLNAHPEGDAGHYLQDDAS